MKDLIAAGKLIPEAEIEAAAAELDKLDAPAPRPRTIGLPLSQEQYVANRQVCERDYANRGRRDCKLTGRTIFDHAAAGDCPLKKFPFQIGIAPKGTGAAALHPSGFSFFDADRRPHNMHDRYRGRSAFLVCGGPSFGKVDHAQLRRPGILTMGINNSVKTFRPDLWIHGDGVDHFVRSVFEDPTISKFSPLGNAGSEIFDSTKWAWAGKRLRDCPNVIYYKLGTGFKPDTFLRGEHAIWGNTGKEGGGRSTMMAAIRVLYELGVRTIYLLGADFNMSPEQPYHFEQGKGSGAANGNNYTYRKLNERFGQLRPIFETTGLKVFNCNPDSKLTAFSFTTFNSAIGWATKEFGGIDVEKERTAGLYDAKKPDKPNPQARLWGTPLPADHPRIYSHSNHAGDLLYALPTIKAFGGGRLHIVTGRGITEQIARSLTTLCEKQSYITSVTVSAAVEGVDMGRWKERFHQSRSLNIANQTLGSFALPYSWSNDSWLNVGEPTISAPVVIHRSPRYQNESFPWTRVLEQYRGKIVMVGTKQEHRTFCDKFADIPYLYTADYLALARVIAGCKLFVGNQSSPYAVAEGMKKPTVLELCLRLPNCCWDRSGAVYGRDSNIALPELSD